MRGVIVAAGRGSRMGSLTATWPKCLLPIGGRPLLAHTIDNLRAAGCDEIVVVTGYRSDDIRIEGITRVLNANYPSNNVLHSLMSARSHLDGAVMVTYSDVWVEPAICQNLASVRGDIVLVVDRDWRPYYEGRTAHPVSEAENVYYDGAAKVARLGKGLELNPPRGLRCGEFLGLWYMSETGTREFRTVFDELNSRLEPSQPFQAATAWTKAYITDMMQELVDREHDVSCVVVERGWAELDTSQDYERLQEIAERQYLWKLMDVTRQAGT